MNYWLMKSEPDVWSLEQQKKTGAKGAAWDGVRNYQARNNLKKMFHLKNLTNPPKAPQKKNQSPANPALTSYPTKKKFCFGKKFLFSWRKSDITSPGKEFFLLSTIFPDNFSILFTNS